MLNLLRAEWLKTNGNRWTAGLLVWIFPLGALGGFVAMGIFIALGMEPERLGLTQLRWTEQMIYPWATPTGFMGQLFLIALAAFVFAGESTWNTWKNIVPRGSRTPLIAAKYITMMAMIFIAFNAMAIIAGIGSNLISVAIGSGIQPAEIPAEFVRDYALQVTNAMIATLLATSYTAIAAMLTGSILFSVIGGFLLTLLDQAAIVLVLTMTGQILGRPDIIVLHQYFPSYNLANISAWATTGTGYTYPTLALYAEPHRPETSLLILLVWIVGVLSLTITIFRMRDIG